MQIGMIGLGKMGYGLSLNLLKNGFDVVAYDVEPANVSNIAYEGAVPAATIEALIGSLQKPRTIWMMVPAGEPTEQVYRRLMQLLEPGDRIIDGGNAHYRDSVRRNKQSAEQGVHFFDCGTSGGVEGARNGACAMIGGDENIFREIEPVFQALTVENGYLYAGEGGSGHYLKMIHNGIEYGMMQAIAEGFELLEKGPFQYDYEKVARVWNNGSVIRSWLMELTESAFFKDSKLQGIKGVMHSSGEGKWTVETALELNAAAPVIALSLMMRYRSLENDTFTGKVVAALRNEFGGHAVEKATT